MFFEKFVSLAIRSNVWKSEYLKVLSGNLEIKKFAKSNVCKSKNLKVPLSLSLSLSIWEVLKFIKYFQRIYLYRSFYDYFIPESARW